MLYDLKLAGKRKEVTWEGRTGVDAATRYVDAHRDAEVIAWREHVQTNFIARGPFNPRQFID